MQFKEYYHKYISMDKLQEVNPIVEIYRHMLVCQLKKHVYNVLNRINNTPLKVATNILVRYILLQIAHNATTIDKLIPYNGGYYVQLKKDIANLVLQNPQPNQVNDILKELDLKRMCNNALLRLIEFVHNTFHRQKNPYIYEIITQETRTGYTFDIKINNTLLSKENILGDTTFDKLTITHRNYKKLSKCNKSNRLNEIIFCLLLRYKSLNLNTYGLAIPPNVMHVIQMSFNIQFELFGSPLNNYCKHYCSIFKDIEKHFNSHGSFFELSINKGNFEVNPPFDEELIKLTIDKLIECLRSKDPVLFFLVIPGWKSVNNYGIYEGLIKLQQNPSHVTYHTKIKKNHHKYFNYDNSTYINACDTYIFILQNNSSRRIMNVMKIKKAVQRVIRCWTY